MKTALITGITGQDGMYLAEQLLAKGCRVIGAVRAAQLAELMREDYWNGKIELIDWNMLDQHSMMDVLANYKPTEIYNFAAYSSGAGMHNDPVGISEVNGVAVTRLLEAIRKSDSNIRFCQASSREIFGEAIESPQTEFTLVNPRSPYGAAKLYADNMIRIYRQQYGLFACSAILYNHESPRRRLDFVTRKITHAAASIKLGLSNKLILGNLDARRDWGFAGDYVRAMWLMLQQPKPDDYVIATGNTHSVSEFCEMAFGYLGLDFRNYLQSDSNAYRLAESVELAGNPEKARAQLGWMPEVTVHELVAMMVEADLTLLRKAMCS